MSATHPEQAAEQAYIDAAYARLDTIRERAKARAAQHARESASMPGQMYDRDVSIRVALHRAEQLDIGDESIIFGRTDVDTGDRFYIGRRAVSGEHHEPLVIDWRVAAAEPFYRATGQDPMGLLLRRHFLCEGRRLLSVEDEHFGQDTDLGLAGSGVLLAALERPRTGTMRDIAATIRSEQDRIIRAPLEGILAVQGGPGTGKTAVALHRAAFLLFTHRSKLGRQGILVVGPNRFFLRYIERVLPALGESGAHLVMLEDLVDGVRVNTHDSVATAKVKGDLKMAKVIARAVRNRQGIEPIKDAPFEFDGYEMTIPAADIHAEISRQRRSRRNHNARHAMLRRGLSSRIYDRYARLIVEREGSAAGLATIDRKSAEKMIRSDPAFDQIVDAVWPLLTPKRLLAGLFASRSRLRAAASGVLPDHLIQLLIREDGAMLASGDVPLLDEAFTLLGKPLRERNQNDDEDLDEVETYGHVVADEVQDLTPMALRMLARRARHGSMTIVGDLAQSVGAVPPESWDEILVHLPTRQGAHVEELTINYRTPGAIMDVAARILRHTAPNLEPPVSVRDGGEPIEIISGSPLELTARLATEHRSGGRGTLCLIAPPSMLEAIAAASHATADITAAVCALPVEDAKGLEFDEVIVVEPARIVSESAQHLRALYVALTRATHRVRIIHAEPLPAPL